MALPAWQYPEGYLDFVREHWADPEYYGFLRDDFSEEGVTTDVWSSASADPYVFLHTPTVMQPKGVLVVAGHNNFPQVISGVTYGGVALPQVDVMEADAGSEEGVIYAWFLGDSAQIPEGPQNVSIAHDAGDGSTRWAAVVTFDGLGDMEVITTAQAKDASIVLPFIYPIDTGSRLAHRYIAWWTGYGSMNDVDPGPPMIRLAESGGSDTALDRLEEQGRGVKAINLYHDGLGSGVGDDDFGALMLAIGTVPTFTGSTLGVHGYETARVLFSYMPPFWTEDPLIRDLLWAQALELDHVRAALDGVVAGWFVEFAPEWALQRWEAETGRLVAPDGLTEGQRRAAVLSDVRSSARTVADFVEFTAAFFGIPESLVDIIEDYDSYTVQVNVQTGLTAAQQEAFEHAFRRILPAHLAAQFNYGAFIAGVSLAGDTV